MISMKRILPVAALALAVFALGTVVSAQDAPTKTSPEKMEKQERMERRGGKGGMRGSRGMHDRGGFGSMLRGIHQLDLTDAQKSQIRTLMETHMTVNKPMMDEMRTLMMKRREGSFTDEDKARIDEIHSGMKESGDQLRATVLGLLTPEQNTKLEQMKAERKERMELRKQRHLERREQKKEWKLKQGEKPVEPVVKQP